MEKKNLLALVCVSVCFLWCAGSFASDRPFTLSDEKLMSLDVYHRYDPNSDPNLPRIIAIRDVEGPGVEFDIFFPPDNENKDNISLYYVSSYKRGKGTLVGIDVNDFDAFALKFTLIAIDGRSDIGKINSLVVGAFGDNGYNPQVISFLRHDEAVSITAVHTKKTAMLGFQVNKFTADGWGPEGNKVTIRIEAAPDSEVL